MHKIIYMLIMLAFMASTASADSTSYSISTFKKTFKHGKSENTAQLIKVKGNTSLSAWFDAKNKKILFQIKKVGQGISYDVKMSVNMQTETLLSVSETTRYYEDGAAHGISDTKTYNFNPQTGLQLPTNPFVSTGAKLDEIIKKRLNKELAENGFESLNKHPVSGWYPKDGKIFLYWKIYEIGSYANGTCDTGYNVSELSEFLNTDIYRAIQSAI